LFSQQNVISTFTNGKLYGVKCFSMVDLLHTTQFELYGYKYVISLSGMDTIHSTSIA